MLWGSNWDQNTNVNGSRYLPGIRLAVRFEKPLNIKIDVDNLWSLP
jgi:hypothetical protein